MLAEQKAGGYSTKYRFTGKEVDEETGLYYFGARYYDPRISLWYGVDPLAEKNYAYTPYVYTGNNPIRFIDPDGRDWYEDECSGKMQWFEGSGKQNGFKHRGAEFQSGKDLYRKDGSVLFGSHSNAVDYMVKTTELNKKEQFAFINGNSMLVAPDKHNLFDESKPKLSGYKISDGKVFDPVDQKTRNFDATAHTHPVGNNPSGPYPPGDINTQEWIYPSKPGFVIGASNGKVAGYGGGISWPAVSHTTEKNITVKGLISGRQKFPKYDTAPKYAK